MPPLAFSPTQRLMGRWTHFTLPLSEELLRPAPVDPSTVYSEITIRKRNFKSSIQQTGAASTDTTTIRLLRLRKTSAIKRGPPLDFWSGCLQSVTMFLQHGHRQPHVHPPLKLPPVTARSTSTKYPSMPTAQFSLPATPNNSSATSPHKPNQPKWQHHPLPNTTPVCPPAEHVP